MSVSNFTFIPGQWYAMTMYPGYVDKPYRSPIEVQRFCPVGNRAFELSFFSFGYAEGVQMMEKRFRTIHRHVGSMITVEAVDQERTTIFETLTIEWIAAFMPRFGERMITAIQSGQKMGFYDPPRP